jgi:8-oxo-dGTP diphosphatase
MPKDRLVQTVCYIINRSKDEILLGRKKNRANKRGIGIGKLNGPGGKFDSTHDENVNNTNSREITEETGLILLNFEKRGIVLIENDLLEFVIELHVYFSDCYCGELIEESDEMINKWFKFNVLEEIYSEMWPSDRTIVPLILGGGKFIGYVHYNEQGVMTDESVFQEVNSLPASI